MNIVVLDADPAFGSGLARGGPPVGKVEVSELESLGALTVFPTTAPEQVVERAREADVILTNKVALGAEELNQLPRLRLVSVLATGYNIIDLPAAAARGVVVCNVPGYSTASTAQHTIALLLELINQVGQHDAHVHAGHYATARTFSYYLAPLMELSEKTLGVVGLGAIGTRVAEIARAMGMKVIAHRRTQQSDSPCQQVTLDTLLRESDVVSLHCPLSEQTHHMIDRAALAKMKHGAYLLNVSRGPIVDEAALAEALMSGHLAGAATDVLTTEPPHAGSPLLGAPRCIITPHIAWATVEARQRLLSTTCANIRAFYQGNPQNRVDGG